MGWLPDRTEPLDEDQAAFVVLPPFDDQGQAVVFAHLIALPARLKFGALQPELLHRLGQTGLGPDESAEGPFVDPAVQLIHPGKWANSLNLIDFEFVPEPFFQESKGRRALLLQGGITVGVGAELFLQGMAQVDPLKTQAHDGRFIFALIGGLNGLGLQLLAGQADALHGPVVGRSFLAAPGIGQQQIFLAGGGIASFLGATLEFRNVHFS